jgi:hypothetical protein
VGTAPKIPWLPLLGLAITGWAAIVLLVLVQPILPTLPALPSLWSQPVTLECKATQAPPGRAVCLALVIRQGSEAGLLLRAALEARRAYGPGEIDAIVAAMSALLGDAEPITRTRAENALVARGFPESRAKDIAGEFAISR